MNVLAQFRIKPLQRMFKEQSNVVPAVAQRRHFDREAV